MNILYITQLNGDAWAGPTYSVPNQIAAQLKNDDVFWYNLRETKIKEWHNLEYYHDLNDYPDGRIRNLPVPFNAPDIIVVEQFYGFAGKGIIREIEEGQIPYIIVPRCELTNSAQKRKRLKKLIANALIFKKFARNAAGIQYLTEQEKNDSNTDWNKNGMVIPNGIMIPDRGKEEYSATGIKCVTIGRIEPYQKGLDILIEACSKIADDMRKSLCTVDIFGPDYDGLVETMKKQIKEKDLEDIIQLHDGLYGDDKEKVLLDSDVFILSSRFEGHPMALIEALSYGLPCVVTKGSNMKKEIEEYEAGWTAENDVESLKDALLKMLSSEKNVFCNKGKNAKTLAEEYSWVRIAKVTSEKLAKLCN